MNKGKLLPLNRVTSLLWSQASEQALETFISEEDKMVHITAYSVSLMKSQLSVILGAWNIPLVRNTDSTLLYIPEDTVTLMVSIKQIESF